MTRPRIQLWPHQIIHLPEYSCSLPTGTSSGKFWKRRRLWPYFPAVWTLGMYGDPKDGCIPIFWFDIELYQGPQNDALVRSSVYWDLHFSKCTHQNLGPKHHVIECVPTEFKIFFDLYIQKSLYPEAIALIQSYLGVKFDEILIEEIIQS